MSSELTPATGAGVPLVPAADAGTVPGERRERRAARRARSRRRAALVVAVAAVVAIATGVALRAAGTPRHGSPAAAPQDLAAPTLHPAGVAAVVFPGAAPKLPFPTTGQSAVYVDHSGLVGATPDEHPVPMASVTKIMTAVIVLRDHPIGLRGSGPTFTMTEADHQAWIFDSTHDDSNLEVVSGERLTERQLLEALLIPSADNMADYLARWDAGSIAKFVVKMNDMARRLHMTDSHYADASGLDPRSASTAADQALLGGYAMRDPTFVGLVDHQTYTFPIEGSVLNYNPVVGQDGIVGVKSGFTSAASGCLVTAAPRTVGGERVMVVERDARPDDGPVDGRAGGRPPARRHHQAARGPDGGARGRAPRHGDGPLGGGRRPRRRRDVGERRRVAGHGRERPPAAGRRASGRVPARVRGRRRRRRRRPRRAGRSPLGGRRRAVEPDAPRLGRCGGVVKATAPASSANLGPGFDALAVALGLHVEVEVRPAPALEVATEGEGGDLPCDGGHLAVRVVRSVLGHDRFSLRVRSDIPVGRGLGSSAALAVAAAAAAGAEDPLGVAVGFEGHAENAAASVLGGLVSAAITDRGPIACRLPLDPTFEFVVLVPDRHLRTSDARAALATDVARADAVFNLGRMGLLVAGLADRGQLVREAGEDRLHQRQRAPLFPESGDLLAALSEAGALVSCWSGAGPSLLAICDAGGAAAVERAGASAMAAHGVAGRAVRLEPDRAGLVVEP